MREYDLTGDKVPARGRLILTVMGLMLALYGGLKVWFGLATGVTDFHLRHGRGTVIYRLADDPAAYWMNIAVFAGMCALGLFMAGRGVIGRRV